MSVYYTGGGGGGLFGTILGGLASVVPGLQPFAPFLLAGNALANGDPAGAAMAALGGIVNKAAAGALGGGSGVANEDAWRKAGSVALGNAYDKAAGASGAPPIKSDPVTGQVPASGPRLDFTDSVSREQGGLPRDAWLEWGRRRRI